MCCRCMLANEGHATHDGSTAVYIGSYKWWIAWARDTGLPQKNSAFGDKTASYTVSELGCQGQGKAKIFFTRDAKNHPDPRALPNWMYYWSQTEAGIGFTYYYGGSGQGAKSGTMKYCGTRRAWVCIIYDRARLSVSLHNVRTSKNYTYESINFFAFVVRHEAKHRDQFIKMWGDGGGSSTSPYDPTKDTVGDGLRDTMRGSLVHGRPYTIQSTPTYPDNWGYGSGFNDAEDAAMWEQIWPDATAYDNVDWAKPGRQYKQGYTSP